VLPSKILDVATMTLVAYTVQNALHMVVGQLNRDLSNMATLVNSLQLHVVARLVVLMMESIILANTMLEEFAVTVTLPGAEIKMHWR
jgi:hypothetical protein